MSNVSINQQSQQSAPDMLPLKRKVTLRYEITVILALAIMFIFFSLLSPSFLGPFILPGILLMGAELGILALGQTVVMISGEIDLSIASVYGWAAVLATVFSNLGLPYPISLVIAIAFGCMVGFLNGLITQKLKIPSLIATLGMMWILRGTLIGLFGNTFISYRGGKSLLRQSLGGRVGYFPGLFFWFVGIALLFNYILYHTRIGNWIFATGGNSETARALGVNTIRSKITSFVLCSALAAFAGGAYIGRIDWFLTRIGMTNMGYGLEVEAIAASIMGGTAFTGGKGSVIAVSIAAFAYSSFKSGLILAGASGYWLDAFVAVLLIIFCLLQKLGHENHTI